MLSSGNMLQFVSGFLRPDFMDWRDFGSQMLVTVQIAVWGTFLAVICAVPCGLLCSENIAAWWIRHVAVGRDTRLRLQSYVSYATGSHCYYNACRHFFINDPKILLVDSCGRDIRIIIQFFIEIYCYYACCVCATRYARLPR